MNSLFQMSATVKEEAINGELIAMIGGMIMRTTEREAETVPNGIGIAFVTVVNGMTARNGTASIRRRTTAVSMERQRRDTMIRTLTTLNTSSTTNSCDVPIRRRMPSGIARTTVRCRQLRCSVIC